MRHYKYVLFFLCFWSQLYAANIADYTIKAEFLPKTKSIKASLRLHWTNTSLKSIKELQFHAYLNAFRSGSTFCKEQDHLKIKKTEAGKLQLESVKMGKSKLKVMYFRPDDLNADDSTVFRVVLPKPLAPNESIDIDVIFESFLPKAVARTGWEANDFFFVGQWFPKIGVLEKNGEWNCHQFHARTEFYADFGQYKIDITLPRNFVIASTGVQKEKIAGDKKRITIVADNVHDFAWAASPLFKLKTERFKGINLQYYMMPEHESLWTRYSKSAKAAISYMGQEIGQYPHPTLSVIDPPSYASATGGMEYPMLITCGSNSIVSSSFRFQEVVTIHEFVHQYFQGMLASNEFENSWLDEGFTQYFEGKIMDKYYAGSALNVGQWHVNDLESSRMGYVGMRFPNITAMRVNAWTYPKGTYGIMSYQKPATILKTIENYVGDKKMLFLLSLYFEKFKFQHPTPEDFIDICKENIKDAKLLKFIEEAIYTNKTCDYSPIIDGKTLTLKNKGSLFIDTKVKVQFTDGSTHIMNWDGYTFEKTYSKAIDYVTIDPELKNWMDLNWTNNSVLRKKDHWLTSNIMNKALFFLQYLMA